MNLKRNRILTIKEEGKRIIVDSFYCRVGARYERHLKPIKPKQDEKNQ